MCGISQNRVYLQAPHGASVKIMNVIEITDKWYEHKPETVMHNKDNNTTITWDMPVNTDRTITANRPDIIVKDSVNSTRKLIDITIPSDKNNELKEIEKKSKYKLTHN